MPLSKSLSTVRLTRTAMFTALICVCSLVSIRIPISPAPITMQTFAILLSATLLGKRQSFISVLVYILLGAFGLPVFSGLNSGFGVLLGATGGFIIGFLPSVYVVGFLVAKIENSKKRYRLIFIFISCLVGIAIVHICGCLWLMYLNKLSLAKALAIASFPYIPVDIVKVAMVTIIYRHLGNTSLFKIK